MSEYVVAEPKHMYVENSESFEKIRGRVYRYDDDSYTIYLQRVRSRLIKKILTDDEWGNKWIVTK